MPFLIPVCPSPTHPHAHTTYVAERNSNQGKDRERERFACLGVCVSAWVCVSVGTHVSICGVITQEMFPFVSRAYIPWGQGGRNLEMSYVSHLGLAWAQIWIPNPQTFLFLFFLSLQSLILARWWLSLGLLIWLVEERIRLVGDSLEILDGTQTFSPCRKYKNRG